MWGTCWARPCRARSVTPPSPGCIAVSRMQPSRRPGAASGRHSPPPQSDQHAVGDMQGMGSESGARAVVPPRGTRPVCRQPVREQTSVAWWSAVLRLSRPGRMAAPDGQFCCAYLCAEWERLRRGRATADPQCIQRQAFKLGSCGVSSACPRSSMLICGQDLWTGRRQGCVVVDASMAIVGLVNPLVQPDG